MINRQNWLDIRAYLYHIEHVRQNDAETVSRTRSHLRHLLEWADETLLPKAKSIEPILPAYLQTARARNDGKDQVLAAASVVKCLTNVRQFYAFARTEWPLRYRTITESWIELQQPPRNIRSGSRLPVRHFYGIEDVLKIASVSTETLREARGQVAVCMLFLSGMRADALASLPISCVDLATREISQLPERGVRTKNRKAALTTLLVIPELMEVVKRWNDRLIAAGHGPDTLWYSTLTRDGMTLTSTTKAFDGRHNVIERDVRLICKLAGVPYQSPHKLRHGHVVYALKLARNMAELKAISQNVMHASVTITDQVYGRLLDSDVQTIISNLGQSHASSSMEDKLDKLLSLLQAQF
jgi:integrase